MLRLELHNENHTLGNLLQDGLLAVTPTASYVMRHPQKEVIDVSADCTLEDVKGVLRGYADMFSRVSEDLAR